MINRISVLERIIRPGQGTLATELAEYILQLDFPPEDRARYLELSSRTQTGTLTKDEEADLDDLLAANDMLTILHSKARTSLNSRTPAA